MDNYGSFGLNASSKPSRRRRSNLHRRPTNETDYPQEYRDSVSLSSTPSDHVSDAPSEGNVVNDAINQRKGLFDEGISRAWYTNLADAENSVYDEGEVYDDAIDLKRPVDDNPAEACWKNLKVKDNKESELEVGGAHSRPIRAAYDGIGNKFNKVKLKVGGVTHTIHAKSSSDGSSAAGTSSAKSAPLDEINNQENFDLHSSDEKGGLRGVPWKDFSRTGFGFSKVEASGVNIEEESVKHRSSKSKPMTKKYLADEAYDEDEEDEEILYLQKLKTSKIASFDYIEYEDETRVKKLRKISRVMERNIDDKYYLGTEDYDSSRSVKVSKKSRAYEDTDYREDDESVSDDEVEHKKKKQRKVPIDVSECSKGSSITTRRRAILTSRDVSPAFGPTQIQFPDGLPPAPPRKSKEQLSEVEQQLKRAEAAQRRRIQTEKAARESEAEAIRKILGQDSSRKKREEKIRKRQEELAKERNASAAFIASNVVRWVMGPSGTVVTFPNEIGLPSIFEHKPSRYPPPREKCAGPSCTNVYKYRDSKSKLPLCSLQCYKAIHEKAHSLHAC